MTYRGLELRANLAEPLEDRQSLENLAGVGIDQDLGIFVNNLKNTSQLLFDPTGLDAGITSSSDGQPSRRLLFGRRVPFVYTNGDRVTVQVRSSEGGEIEATDVSGTSGDTNYFVVDFEFGLGDFNNQRAIGLATTEGGSPVDLSAINGKYVTLIRDDSVVQENLLNIATPDILNSSLNTGETDVTGVNFFSYDVGDDFDAAFNRIETNINISNFRRIEKFKETESVISDELVEIQGTLKVQDPAAELNTPTDLENETAPGIYITDPFSDLDDIERTRAFSTSSNPWIESGSSTLLTESAQVNIGDLRFDGGLEIDGLTVESVGSSTPVTDDFTHKLPVYVDGVKYSLLLKSST